MAYCKAPSIPIKSSASLLCNNLAVLRSDEGDKAFLAVVHKSVVWVFNPREAASKTSDGTVPYKQVVCKGEGAHSSSTILQAKWCIMPQRTLLVITSVKGAQMFEADGSVMVFWQALAPNTTEGLAQYARGVCAVGESYICIGVANGGILVFDVPNKGPAVKLQETLEVHQDSIADLASDGDAMISADETGKIILWKAGGHFTNVLEIEGHGYPASSLALWNNLIIAAYGTGHVRIFDSSDGTLQAEICAHGKWINALDIARDSGMMVTVSEDSFIRVWKIARKPFTVDFIFQHSITDVQLCGAKFLDQSGKSFAVTGYDSTEVVVFNAS